MADKFQSEVLPRITIRIDEDYRKKLAARAAQNLRTVSSEARFLMDRGLEAEELADANP